MKRLSILVTLALTLALLLFAGTGSASVWVERPEPVDACHVKCETKYRCNQRCRHVKNHEHCMTMCEQYKSNCMARCGG